MQGNPFACDRLDLQCSAQLLFALMAVVLDLADLLDHARAEQGVFVDEGDAHQVAVFLLLAAPGHHARIPSLLAEQRDAQLDGNTVKIRDADPGSAGPARPARHSPFKTFAPRGRGASGGYQGRRPPPHFARGGRKFRGPE